MYFGLRGEIFGHPVWLKFSQEPTCNIDIPIDGPVQARPARCVKSQKELRAGVFPEMTISYKYWNNREILPSFEVKQHGSKADAYWYVRQHQGQTLYFRFAEIANATICLDNQIWISDQCRTGDQLFMAYDQFEHAKKMTLQKIKLANGTAGVYLNDELKFRRCRFHCCTCLCPSNCHYAKLKPKEKLKQPTTEDERQPLKQNHQGTTPWSMFMTVERTVQTVQTTRTTPQPATQPELAMQTSSPVFHLASEEVD